MGPHWRRPALAVAALDLRSIAQAAQAATPSGFGLFVTPNAANLGSEYENLGTDPIAPWNAASRTRWRAALALPQTLVANNLRDAAWETLTIQADPIGDDRALPIVPTTRRDYELWLAGQRIQSKRFALGDPEATPLIDLLKRLYRSIREASLAGELRDRFGQVHLSHYRKVLGDWVRKYGINYRHFQPADLPDEEPLTPETTLTDNFNRADQSGLGTSSEGWSWVALNGSAAISSNVAVSNDAGAQCENRADANLSSTDHYSQADAIAGFGTNSFSGVFCRKEANATRTFYSSDSPNATSRSLRKRVAGTGTVLRTDAITQSFPDTIKVQANGSTIEHFYNGVSLGTATDTAITAGVQCGVVLGFGSLGVNQFDNFEAADLGGGGSPIDVTPAAATAKAACVSPTVSLGSLSLSPAVAASRALALGPSVQLGGLSITPAPAVARATAVSPTVQQASVSITPAAASAAAACVSPTIEQGSLSLTPAAAESSAVAIAPTLGLSSLSITPLAAIVRAVCVAPTVTVGVVGVAKFPAGGTFVAAGPKGVFRATGPLGSFRAGGLQGTFTTGGGA